MSAETRDPGWRDRPALAWTTAALIRGGPVVAGLVASLAVATVLPAPEGPAEIVGWWAAVAATPLAVVVLAERGLRTVAPLPFLLRLPIAFPDEAPSRLKVTREAHRTRQLLDRLTSHDIDELEVPPTAASTLALITALERHDRFTRGHAERVRLYTDLLGEELGLSESERERLRWAGLLHDIGKLRVDPEVLNKDGRPDEDEWAQLRRHPSLGFRLSSALIPWLGDWSGAIVDHHERFDGTGYPAGKAGPDISLAGRIVAVADSYETMTAGRPYKQPLTKAQARDELVACAGTQFDPRVVRAFLNLSLPRARWPLVFIAWLLQVPLLLKLRAAPKSALQGVTAAAGVVTMAAAGLVSPMPVEQPLETPPGDVLAQPDDPEETPGPGPDPGRSAFPDDVVGRTEAFGLTTEMDRPGSGGDGAAGTSSDPDSEADTTDDDPSGDGDDSGSGDSDPVGPGSGDSEGEDAPTAPREVGHDDSTILTALYLEAVPAPSPRYDALPLSGQPPDRTRLGNYDTDVDDQPGLRLLPTHLGRDESRIDRRQRWALTREAVAVVAGPLQLDIWIQPAGPDTQMIELAVFVDVCDVDLQDCEAVSEASSSTTGTSGVWKHVTMDLAPAGHVSLQQRVLVVTLTAGRASTSPVLVAFGTTSYPAALTTAQVQLAGASATAGPAVRGGVAT